MNDQLLLELPGIAPLSTTPQTNGVMLDRKQYIADCEHRWHGPALTDARGNWHHFESMKADLLAAMRQYQRNQFLKDAGGKCHNPEGTLTALLWKLQDAWQPDKSRLDPLIDFCDHYQRFHLRRGLIIYCSMLLRQLEGAN